jgi:Domain of unknown function (DUF4386)
LTTDPTSTERATEEGSQRSVAFVAGVALLFIAVLAAFAQFFVLQTLVVPADATATVTNITASDGLFRSGIAAFLIVIMLDVVVAWGLYVLLMPVNRTLALLVGWLRLAFAAVFAVALANLLDAAQLIGGAERSTLQPGQLEAQAMSSIASFDNAWAVGLAIFGLHLVGLGYLLFKSANFPRLLGVLVVIAGGGYLVDTFATVLIRDYALTISVFTFVGEALLIFWLLGRAITGFRSDSETVGRQVTERLAQPTRVAS